MGIMNDLTVAYYGPGFDMTTAPMPAAEYTWMVAVIIIALIALWQARTFVSQF
ncbi:hypothetical protein [Methanococcoides alaskense]|uniref:Uncharacterized protein n=1 Tax=Methanococcoides alaskense TaxID=325778 RepID=A0AA90Z6F3_9EURY|nr:hypothetical protein [Methanococcoides alaskense]MDA0525062.1 hypothetical protein [Methanococcoides alaskense]MDR6222020.1 hypothetical protein [Methanococcoides alaskense]